MARLVAADLDDVCGCLLTGLDPGSHDRGLPAPLVPNGKRRGAGLSTSRAWRTQRSSIVRSPVLTCTPARSSRALDPVTGKFTPKKFRNDPHTVTAWVRSLPRPVSVVHEARPTGYTLARHFEEAGLCVCVIAAPSKLQRLSQFTPPRRNVRVDAYTAFNTTQPP